VTGRTLLFGGEFGFEGLDARPKCGNGLGYRLVPVVTARTALYEPAFFGPAFFGSGVGDCSSSEDRVRGREEASPEFGATDDISAQLVKLDPKLGDDRFA
jgi:hypothetical protein